MVESVPREIIESEFGILSDQDKGIELSGEVRVVTALDDSTVPGHTQDEIGPLKLADFTAHPLLYTS